MSRGTRIGGDVPMPPYFPISSDSEDEDNMKSYPHTFSYPDQFFLGTGRVRHLNLTLLNLYQLIGVTGNTVYELKRRHSRHQYYWTGTYKQELKRLWNPFSSHCHHAIAIIGEIHAIGGQYYIPVELRGDIRLPRPPFVPSASMSYLADPPHYIPEEIPVPPGFPTGNAGAQEPTVGDLNSLLSQTYEEIAHQLNRIQYFRDLVRRIGNPSFNRLSAATKLCRQKFCLALDLIRQNVVNYGDELFQMPCTLRDIVLEDVGVISPGSLACLYPPVGEPSRPSDGTEMFLYLLYESVAGYALFDIYGLDVDEQSMDAACESVLDVHSFEMVVKLAGFSPFFNSDDMLTQHKAISEGNMTIELKNFLKRSFRELYLPRPKEGRKAWYSLGVADPNLGKSIYLGTGIGWQCNEFVLEMLRGVRLHCHHFIKQLEDKKEKTALLFLGHRYSDAKVKTNVDAQLVIESLIQLDNVDKDINSFSMSVRDWFYWQFPVDGLENVTYAKVMDFLFFYKHLFCARNRDGVERKIHLLVEIVGDEYKAREIAELAMGQFFYDFDNEIFSELVWASAERVRTLLKYRESIHAYLFAKVNSVAPNLTALVGQMTAARLIKHASGLSKLVDYPEWRLRSLFLEGESGVIFFSIYIEQASVQNRGEMALFLANKCLLAARVDCYSSLFLLFHFVKFGHYRYSLDCSTLNLISDLPTHAYGERLRDQVEEKFNFLETAIPNFTQASCQNGVSSISIVS